LAQKKYIYIDECGDPEFYGKRKKLLVGAEGYQPLLLIGMIVTDDRRKLWDEVTVFQNQILTDSLYNSIHSVKQQGWYLHAKNDFPDVRSKFFEKLRDLEDFESYIVIGRKSLDIFNNKHNNNAGEFYFDLLHHLLKGKITNRSIKYEIYLSQREKSNMSRFAGAVKKGLTDMDGEILYKCHIVSSSVTPELSITDYLLWALQRYILKNEDRFYKAVIDKYTEIYDIYDIKGEKVYDSNNAFDINKASGFDIK